MLTRVTTSAVPSTRGRPGPSRLLVGAAIGSVVWPADLLVSAAAVVAGRSRTVARLVAVLVAAHRRRLVRWHGWADDAAPAPLGRATAFLAARVGVGVVGSAVLGLLVFGLYAAVVGLLSWLFDVRVTVSDPLAAGQVTTSTMLVFVPLGAVLLYLDLMGLAGVGVLDRAAADRWLAADRTARLARQVEELTLSRIELLAALDAERARIERDLHDGVQQRAVAVGLLVGRARRAAEPGTKAHELLDRAAVESEHLLTDLRDVAWRVRPTSLDTRGLGPVLHQLADRTDPPTTVRWDRPRRLPADVETTVYYVVAEAMTNVSRHARATRADIAVEITGEGADEHVRVTVTDDGVGGADARSGHGIAGLTGRVASVGGSLTVDSPPGGPTRLEVVVPCA